jgi:hypothetical protein
VGFGADEEQGEEVRVWVLKPGLYKIVRAGGTYRDRENFATVQLEAGKLTRFTLVLDEATGDFKGAGVVAEAEAPKTRQGPWRAQAVIGGDVQVSHSDETATRGWNIDLSLFLDGQLRFQDEPHLFAARLEVEEGQLRAAGQRRFEPIIDRLYVHSIYTYHLVPWFGPYARAGLETKLMPRYKSYDTPRDVQRVDADGNLLETLAGTDLVTLGDPLSPLQLKEGAGGNLRLLRSVRVDLDVRAGIGARQYFPRGELAVDSKDENRVRQTSRYRLEGVEGTVVGTARLSRWIGVSTELDGLVPFADGSNTVYTWRSQVSLRLVSFASLNYRLNVTRDPNRVTGPPITAEHFLQLRFSYGLL